MKKIFILFIVLLPGISIAQSNTDSLEALLPNKTGVEKIRILNSLVTQYWAVDPRISLDYGEQALNLAIKSNERLLQAVALKNIAISQYFAGQYSKAIENSKTAIELYKEFDSAVFDNDIFGQPIVLKFTKTSASAPNNIVIRDEYIENSTGLIWYDFHMALVPDVDFPITVLTEENVNPGEIQDFGFRPDHIFQGGIPGNPFGCVQEAGSQ